MKKTYEIGKHYAPAYKASHYSELVDFLSEHDSKLTAERNTINKYANAGLLDGDFADKYVAHIDARRDEIRGMIKACTVAVSACIPAKGVFAKHHRDYLTGAEVNAINKAEELFNC